MAPVRAVQRPSDAPRGAGREPEPAQPDRREQRNRRHDRQRIPGRHVLLPDQVEDRVGRGGAREQHAARGGRAAAARRLPSAASVSTATASGRGPHGSTNVWSRFIASRHSRPGAGEQHVDAFEILAGLRRDGLPVGGRPTGRDDQRHRPAQHADRERHGAADDRRGGGAAGAIGDDAGSAAAASATPSACAARWPGRRRTRRARSAGRSRRDRPAAPPGCASRAVA